MMPLHAVSRTCSYLMVSKSIQHARPSEVSSSYADTYLLRQFRWLMGTKRHKRAKEM